MIMQFVSLCICIFRMPARNNMIDSVARAFVRICRAQFKMEFWKNFQSSKTWAFRIYWKLKTNFHERKIELRKSMNRITFSIFLWLHFHKTFFVQSLHSKNFVTKNCTSTSDGTKNAGKRKHQRKWRNHSTWYCPVSYWLRRSIYSCWR